MADSAHFVSQRCGDCGAPVHVLPGAGLATCAYCGSQLLVNLTSTSAQPAPSSCKQSFDPLQVNTRLIRLQRELDELDRIWLQKQEQLVLRDERGGALPPSKLSAYINGILVGLFGLTLGTGLMCGGLPVMGSVAGLLSVGIAILVGVRESNQAARFVKLQQRYESKRQELLNALDQAQQ